MMDKFPNIVCAQHGTNPMSCYCPDCVEALCSECSYYHTLHLKHRPVPSVFIKFMPALLLQKINRCAIHNENPEFQTSNHGNTCCYKYAIDVHGHCHKTSGTGSVKRIGLLGQQIFKVNAADITGCTILPSGQMIFVDNKYDCLVVHERDGSFNRTIDLLSKPYSVTCINDKRIAVTQHMEVIIINLETDFTENWIDMSYECLGINYINGILLVILSDCICMIAEDGTEHKRINLSICGVSDADITGDKLYVTACHNEHGVYCCDMDGTILWTYQSKSLRGPRQLTTDDRGYIYVVFELSLNVVVLSPDGKDCKVLLCEQDGLHFPKAIRILGSSSQLLVCNSSSCTALIYSVTTCNSSKMKITNLSYLYKYIILFIVFAIFLTIWFPRQKY
jgi:hypothetical protein